jgi:hypothetical protein
MKAFRSGVRFNTFPRRLGLIAQKWCNVAVKDCARSFNFYSAAAISIWELETR